MIASRLACFLSLLCGIFFSVLGQIPEVCQQFNSAFDITGCDSTDSCSWVETSCICSQDDTNIDVYFLIESSNTSPEIWEYLMLAMPTNFIDYIQSESSLINVYVARFGDNTFEIYKNPSSIDINNFEYRNETISSVCNALENIEEYLIKTINTRSTIVITLFANGIDDGPCNINSLSSNIVYGMIDNTYEGLYNFISFDGVCAMDFTTTSKDSISFMEKYVLSVISDYACELESTPTPSPTIATTNQPTIMTTTATNKPTKEQKEYVPYVQYVYHRYKPRKMSNHQSKKSSSSSSSSSSSWSH